MKLKKNSLKLREQEDNEQG